ncbi:tRNA (adenosine(37)-N6)-threonylcarbamoyltransferase complex transferase subunit TsaD [Desulfoluna spongiiphila]|uniref:tRNA (adenosine(37)-N6)-threonylcarbamoyltransferase complex transferase subunit TsaD n=1 Tax=Desulfoluna spongiiphila TaxID=419481 RepID=UPI001254F20E|nr:tRNA (adenosine(37)-N6)-threonylcarbamoyltransferase complex transferase subunit TsaD [Desulfoluna spongiiphila]VVS90909.1 trna n6-adenosine threonylcarbamoyltransferase tsad [Desulfoluna spongiiphila]
MKILAIESSCDETAAAVVEDGTRVLSSVVASQVAVHHVYGGVVPELASRKHVEAIVPVVREAVESAGIHRSELDAVAVTQGPGLVGALLVGFSYAKAYAWGLGIPCVGVNHLEGHMSSIFLGDTPPEFPYVALLVSGGHTSLYYVTGPTEYELMGQTRDDAVGEAYDKVSKMLGLGYPGGVVIDGLARKGDLKAIAFPRPYLDKKAFDFSFSGLKSAVGRHLKDYPDPDEVRLHNIAAGFQESVAEVLCHKLIYAAKVKNCRHIAVVGGVAANSRVRAMVGDAAARRGLSFHTPELKYCGDNAAMIGAIGYHRFVEGSALGLNDDAYSRARLPSNTKHK